MSAVALDYHGRLNYLDQGGKHQEKRLHIRPPHMRGQLWKVLRNVVCHIASREIGHLEEQRQRVRTDTHWLRMHCSRNNW